LCVCCRQRSELEGLRRQLEENSSLAGRALREELDKTREEQERRHQVRLQALLVLSTSDSELKLMPSVVCVSRWR